MKLAAESLSFLGPFNAGRDAVAFLCGKSAAVRSSCCYEDIFVQAVKLGSVLAHAPAYFRQWAITESLSDVYRASEPERQAPLPTESHIFLSGSVCSRGSACRSDRASNQSSSPATRYRSDQRASASSAPDPRQVSLLV